MFKKILIANRGEIAVRVIRTCRELGIETAAIYSDLDKDAMHTRMADEAYSLGGRTAAESYLNTPAIIEAIQKSGADAVHPGYGFFSENTDFSRELTDLGITFIGPPPEAIESMGDKLSARKVADTAGVNGVPGTQKPIKKAQEVKAFAKTYGWPVAVKAAYGGGGRGMKVIQDGDDIQEAIDSAAREAKSYFGRDELYLERYLTWPRHVEVQLLGDSHGSCVYLGTRDCSAQRRHQKLIEEAPAPGIDPKILTSMGEAAISVAKECGYTNAGTIEFLYEDGEFYFLEMNTRLQVEHPATEAIVNMDLVAEQIRIAEGEPLGYSQKDIVISGHSIEIRINAEDPANGSFLPSPGPIQKLRIPGGFETRFDGGYEAGDQVSEYYDNLVGKLICWGKNREEAIARAKRALTEFEVSPIATTIPAALAILSHSDFESVSHSTKWVEEKLDLSHIEPKTAPATEDADSNKDQHNIDVEVNGKRFSVTLWTEGAALGGTGVKKPKRSAAAAASVASQASGSQGEVAVPMQGTIVKVMVEVGQEVEAGDPIVVLEAMKMENNVNAPASGTVQEIMVSAGDTVGNGDIVALIT